MALIYDNTISTAVTQVDIDLTSTPIEKGELYEMVFTLVNGGASSTDVRMYANDQTTLTDYTFQYLRASGTSVTGGRLDGTDINLATASKKGVANIYIKLTNDGKLVLLSNATKNYGDSTIESYVLASTSEINFTTITKLNIIATQTNGIGINSRIQLYKVAEKVDEVIVSGSPVTQVDFTTDIQKGNEYLLVSDIDTAVSAYMELFINDNVTPTNYYNQRIFAINTTVGATRLNDATMIGTIDSTKPALTISKIKLANSGYFNAQSDTIRDYGTNDVDLFKYYSSSTFTASSITKLSVKASQANAIDIGSRFELYKLI